MEYLSGGRESQILRVNNRVSRPSGPWTANVHDLLRHLRSRGFFGAPEPIGIDASGRDVVSFIPGEVSNYPLSERAASQEALVSAARLLRSYHDAAAGFLDRDARLIGWQLPTRHPVEVVCHGDFAPYNVVLDGQQAVGIIDFDTAHPGPRTWDIAYALYRWAPFTAPDNVDGFGDIKQQIERAVMFCHAYGLAASRRSGLAQQVIERLQSLLDYLQVQAGLGDPACIKNLADGHHLLYRHDIGYLLGHCNVIDAALGLE